MIRRLVESVSSALPARITYAEYNDPVFLVGGDNWYVQATTVWRVVESGVLLYSCFSQDGGRRVPELAGESVQAIHPLDAAAELDPAFHLDSGKTLEIFSLVYVEPWVVKLGDQVWVASPSDPDPFK